MPCRFLGVNKSSLASFNEALQKFRDAGDSLRKSMEHSAYLFDFERSFVQNYLNGNAAIILDFEFRGDDDAKLPASLLAMAPNGKTSSVILYSQANGFDLVDGGNEELVLISDVQIVKMLNKPVPSLVGLYIEHNRSEQLREDDMKVNSFQTTFKRFGSSIYGKLCVGADQLGSQFAQCCVPRMIENAANIVDRVPKHGSNIPQISEAIQSIVDDLNLTIEINLNPYCLGVWTSDSTDSLFNLRDVFIGPLKLETR